MLSPASCVATGSSLSVLRSLVASSVESFLCGNCIPPSRHCLPCFARFLAVPRRLCGAQVINRAVRNGYRREGECGKAKGLF